MLCVSYIHSTPPPNLPSVYHAAKNVMSALMFFLFCSFHQQVFFLLLEVVDLFRDIIHKNE